MFQTKEREKFVVTYVADIVKNTERNIKSKLTGAMKVFAKRYLYDTLALDIDNFLSKKTTDRIVRLYGLRGVGKTILLAQLMNEKIFPLKKKHLFVSLDQSRNLGITLSEIITAYEIITMQDLENLTEQVFLFIDEIQAEPNL